MKAIVKEDEKVESPELSEQDMIYYLFVIHDLNGDGYLDGHELRAAFTDFDEEGEHNHSQTDLYRKIETIPFDEITDMVDHVLEEDDTNGE
jgi:Ca2+-binding EF-hand superfamily protein